MKNELENIPEERVILGRILLSPETAFFQVSDVLRPEHFSIPVHQRIYAAIRDVMMDGKKLSLTVLESRVGEEYDDGKSTMTLMTGLVRDAEQGGDLDGVDLVIDLWRHRQHVAELERAIKEAKKPNANSADLIADHVARVEDITSQSQAVPLRSIGQAAKQVITRTKGTRETGTLPGFDTGLPTLDSVLGLINPGDLGVIGAARGDGKTILAAQIANHVQQYGPTILFELEMRAEDIGARAMAGRTSLSVREINSGSFDAFAWEDLQGAAAALADAKFYIDDRPKLAIEQIWDRCRAVKRSRGLTMILVDHFRLIRALARFKDKWERMESISGDLKWMAKDLEIAVGVLSQFTRKSQGRDNPVPRLTDLDGGGPLEQDCDWAALLFRRDRWLREQRPYDMESKEGRAWAEMMVRHKGKVEIYIPKTRRDAEGEMREFEFDGRAGLIREL